MGAKYGVGKLRQYLGKHEQAKQKELSLSLEDKYDDDELYAMAADEALRQDVERRIEAAKSYNKFTRGK